MILIFVYLACEQSFPFFLLYPTPEASRVGEQAPSSYDFELHLSSTPGVWDAGALTKPVAMPNGGNHYAVPHPPLLSPIVRGGR